MYFKTRFVCFNNKKNPSPKAREAGGQTVPGVRSALPQCCLH